mgnify:CR=1 FL=1
MTSCFVMMPTALPASTTTTLPTFSLTKESTTDRSLSSGHAVTALPAGIMKEATEGMTGFCSALLCSALLSRTERRVAREETDERGEK